MPAREEKTTRENEQNKKPDNQPLNCIKHRRWLAVYTARRRRRSFDGMDVELPVAVVHGNDTSLVNIESGRQPRLNDDVQEFLVCLTNPARTFNEFRSPSIQRDAERQLAVDGFYWALE